MPLRLLTALLLALAWSVSAHAEAPRVVASIKPLHSLAAAVMEGIGTPALLVSAGGSPHTYALRPSEARALERAQLVVWVGEGLETFLEKPLASLGGKARIVEMAALPGIRLLKPRQGGAWDIHPGHEHEHGHDGEEAYDSHLWLDTDNARILVAALAGELAALDPAHAQAFTTNAARVTARLEALDGDLRTRLSGVAHAPFLVFHDSYQYFEARYGLNAAGSITVAAERQPGARRLQELRRRIHDTNVRCLFREPQVTPKLIGPLTEGGNVKVGVLDPLGAKLADGPELYFRIMEDLATDLAACLG